MKDFDCKLKQRILNKGILRDEKSVIYSLDCILDSVEGRNTDAPSSLEAWLMPLSKYTQESNPSIEKALSEYLNKFLHVVQDLQATPTARAFHIKVMKAIIQKQSHTLAQDALCTILLDQQSKKEQHPYDMNMIKLLKYIVKHKKIDFREEATGDDSMVVD